MTDKEWCEVWITGFMAALFLNAQGGRGKDWLMLRDEYLDRRQARVNLGEAKGDG